MTHATQDVSYVRCVDCGTSFNSTAISVENETSATAASAAVAAAAAPNDDDDVHVVCCRL